jgi:hypothetical protein
MVILSNLTTTILNRAVIHVYDYKSINSEFRYTCFPEKGTGLESMINSATKFDQENGTKTIICRTFSKNYLKFWMWEYYLINPYYRFPKCE